MQNALVFVGIHFLYSFYRLSLGDRTRKAKFFISNTEITLKYVAHTVQYLSD